MKKKHHVNKEKVIVSGSTDIYDISIVTHRRFYK